MTEFDIASLRNIRTTPAQCCVVEFEDVLVEVLRGTLIQPIRSERQINQASRYCRFNPKLYAARPGRASAPGRVLIIVALTMRDAIKLVLSLLDSIDQYDSVCAYVFDIMLHNVRDNKSHWRKSLSATIRAVQKIDHLFIPMSNHVDDLANYFEIAVHTLPMASDVMQFGSGRLVRPIDVTGYGRQNREHSDLLSQAFNRPDSPRLYYHTDHMTITAITDNYSHRRFFWKILTNSKIALAYNHLDTNPDGRFKYAFLGQRWFESLAAGCLIVGRKPDCQEAEQLFHWQDAMVELPVQAGQVVPFMENLLQDTARLEAAHRRNYHFALTQHDWGHRIAQMLVHLNIPCPPALSSRLDHLAARGADVPPLPKA